MDWNQNKKAINISNVWIRIWLRSYEASVGRFTYSYAIRYSHKINNTKSNKKCHLEYQRSNSLISSSRYGQPDFHKNICHEALGHLAQDIMFYYRSGVASPTNS
jgi:hypothetical protein